MPYKLEWKRNGVIKRYSGVVTFDDVINSERELTGNSSFGSLRFVISDYIGSEPPRLKPEQACDVRALRIGGFSTNPHIKFAFITQDAITKAAILESVAAGEVLHTFRIFETYEQAAAWVGL